MRRIKSFIAITLLLLFAWSRAAEALPLVWCLGSDGHSVVELADSKSCNSADKIDLHVDSGYTVPLLGLTVGEHDQCTDFVLSDEVTKTATKSQNTAPPAALPVKPVAFNERLSCAPLSFSPQSRTNACQLAQLRTVVLRL